MSSAFQGSRLYGEQMCAPGVNISRQISSSYQFTYRVSKKKNIQIWKISEDYHILPQKSNLMNIMALDFPRLLDTLYSQFTPGGGDGKEKVDCYCEKPLVTTLLLEY